MDPITMMLLGAGVQAGSGLIGYLASMPDRERAKQIMQSALDESGKLNVPALEQVVAQEIGPSALEGMTADPQAVGIQRAALTRLGELADSGYTMQDRAAQAEAMRISGRQEQAGRQRILADAAARGQLGAGTTLATLLQNQQGAAERGNEAGLQTAGNAQRRMYEALLARNQAAGNLRGQDWQERSQAAQAKDAIARYNADARRTAQGQRINNAQWTYGAQRQSGADKLQREQMRAGIYGDQANQTGQMIAGAGSAIGQGIGSLGGRMADSADADKAYNRWLESGYGGFSGGAGGRW